MLGAADSQLSTTHRKPHSHERRELCLGCVKVDKKLMYRWHTRLSSEVACLALYPIGRTSRYRPVS